MCILNPPQFFIYNSCFSCFLQCLAVYGGVLCCPAVISPTLYIHRGYWTFLKMHLNEVSNVTCNKLHFQPKFDRQHLKQTQNFAKLHNFHNFFTSSHEYLGEKESTSMESGRENNCLLRGMVFCEPWSTALMIRVTNCTQSMIAAIQYCIWWSCVAKLAAQTQQNQGEPSV